MFWFLQTQLCTSSLTPYPLATPSVLPVSISHAFGFPVLFPCIANVGFLLCFFSIIYFRSKAVSISEQKKESKVGFWRAVPPNPTELQIRKDAWVQPGQGGTSVCGPSGCQICLAWSLGTRVSQLCPDATRNTGPHVAVFTWRMTLLFCYPFSSRNHFSFGGGASWC